MEENVLLKEEVEERGKIVKYNEGFHSKMIDFISECTESYYSGRNCLVLGPSEGVELERILQKRFLSLTFVDGSSRVIEEVKKKIPNQEYIVSLFENMNLKNKFDTIIAHHILEHLDNPVKILTYIKKYSKPDTKIILSVPNAKSIHRMLGVKMGLLKNIYELNDSDIRVGHRKVYDFDSLEKDIICSGLKVIAKFGCFFKPFSNSQLENFSQEQINGFYELGKDFPENCAEIIFICSI